MDAQFLGGRATQGSPAALRARLSSLMDDYDQMRAHVARAQRRMRAVSGTAKSTDATVTVRVDFRGVLTDLQLSPRAYQRYSPSLLAEQILRLVDEARAQVVAEVGDVMAPLLPEGVDPVALAAGDADAAQFLTAAPLSDDTYDAWRARFGGRLEALPEQDTGAGADPDGRR